jgi:ELWxxDGT repeat protein/parallel beta-helix repeat protein
MACGRLLYFAADNGTDGVEFWRVPPGTTTAVIATNVNAGAASSYPVPLGFGGRHLLFAADDGNSGNELWAAEFTTYLVTSTSDSGAGSLRQAILDANAFTNPPGCIDRICIDIAGPGPHILNLQTQLPAVTDPVTLCDPLYDPAIDARFLADGNLLGVTASGLIILTKDTEVIGLGFTRLKTGVKLDQGGANINLQGLLFLQISDVGIEANLAASGLYLFRENRFRGGMNFGTKVNISGAVDVEVQYLNNFHTNNQVAIDANEQLSGSATWIVADNISTNGGSGGRFSIRVAGTKDFARNRWEGHASAGLKYICDISQSVTVVVKSDGDLAVGNGLEGVRGEVSGLGEVRFLLLRLGSSNNGHEGVGLYAQGGSKLILEGHQWDIQRNGGVGLYLQAGGATLKAGYHLQDSVIRKNDRDGQWLVDVEFPFSMLNNTITDNGGNGVVMAGSSFGNISGNTIANNGGAGVLIQDTAHPSLAGNTITGNGVGVAMTGTGTGTLLGANAIFANTGLGFDLGNDGVTPNDPSDGDVGPNSLQNYPVLTSATNSGGTTTISGALNSAANSTYTLRFFVNDTCHPSGHGEGEMFIGSTNVMTDGSGDVHFTFVPASAIALGKFITATATDVANNTSEFSSCRAVSLPPGPPLQISRTSEGRFQISWPDSEPGFTLEFTTNFANPTIWSPATDAVMQTNGQFIVSIDATNAQAFYRLRQP